MPYPPRSWNSQNTTLHREIFLFVLDYFKKCLMNRILYLIMVLQQLTGDIDAVISVFLIDFGHLLLFFFGLKKGYVKLQHILSPVRLLLFVRWKMGQGRNIVQGLQGAILEYRPIFIYFSCRRYLEAHGSI